MNLLLAPRKMYDHIQLPLLNIYYLGNQKSLNRLNLSTQTHKTLPVYFMDCTNLFFLSFFPRFFYYFLQFSLFCLFFFGKIHLELLQTPLLLQPIFKLCTIEWKEKTLITPKIIPFEHLNPVPFFDFHILCKCVDFDVRLSSTEIEVMV